MPIRRLRPLRRVLGGVRLAPRARPFRVYSPPALPDVALVEGLNQPESRVYWALVEMHINFTIQANFLGGSILGGARADFVLPDYKIVLLYSGPFHDTTYGRGRDILSNMSYQVNGFDVRVIVESDLEDLKNRIREIIGIPL